MEQFFNNGCGVGARLLKKEQYGFSLASIVICFIEYPPWLSADTPRNTRDVENIHATRT
jgi:hypothetical protein